jgi:hypothetical protein
VLAFQNGTTKSSDDDPWAGKLTLDTIRREILKITIEFLDAGLSEGAAFIPASATLVAALSVHLSLQEETFDVLAALPRLSSRSRAQGATNCGPVSLTGSPVILALETQSSRCLAAS